MELDSLKVIWNNLGEPPVQDESNEQLLAMLRKKSQSPIAKMRRNLGWELAVVVLLYSYTIYYYITGWKGVYWEIAVVLALVGLLFVGYYFVKNDLLNKMQRSVASEVSSNLKQQLTTLEKYVRFYFISGILLTPIAYYVSGFIIIAKNPDAAAGSLLQHVQETKGLVLFIIGGLVITGAGYFINVWYIRKLYGQHIEKLKSLVREMEHDD
ncbi:MAG: hypothetical protein QM731_19625 [Chitinophagaceae bacterium]